MSENYIKELENKIESLESRLKSLEEHRKTDKEIKSYQIKLDKLLELKKKKEKEKEYVSKYELEQATGESYWRFVKDLENDRKSYDYIDRALNSELDYQISVYESRIKTLREIYESGSESD